VAAVGLVAFDGAGGLTAHGTVSINGVITRRSGRGSYTANANCTGSATLEDDFAGFAFNFVIVPGTDAAELGLIVTNQGSLITGVAKRVEQERCDETILQGSYQSVGGGTVLAAGPNVGVGFRIFDGEGNASGEDTFSDNGEISHRVVSLTYTVESDCSGSFRRGDGALFDLVVVGGGTEILNVRADPGTIITARYKKGS